MSRFIENEISVFCKPYQQDTAFAWANIPSLSLFLPKPQTRPVALDSSTDLETIKEYQRGLSVLKHDNFSISKMDAHRQSASEERGRTLSVEAGSEDPHISPLHRPVAIRKSDRRKGCIGKDKRKETNREATEAGGATCFDLEKDQSGSDGLDSSWQAQPRISFKTQFCEMNKCFRVQMEVHRGINAALRQLNTLEQQARALRGEQRTAELVGRLRLRQERALPAAGLAGSKGLFTTAPFAIPLSTPKQPLVDRQEASSREAGTGSVSRTEETVSPMIFNPLKNILDAFSKPPTAREGKSKPLTPNEAPSYTPRISVEVVKPDKPPQPYKIIRWAPLSPSSSSLSSTSKERVETVLPVNGAKRDKIYDDVVTEIDDSKAASGDRYTDDFEQIDDSEIVSLVGTESGQGHSAVQQNSVDTDISITDSIVDNYSIVRTSHSLSVVGESNLSVQSSIHTTLPSDSARSVPTGTASSVSDEIEDSSHANYPVGKVIASPTLLPGDQTQLFTKALREFYQACRNANFIVSGINAGHFHLAGTPSALSSSSEGSQGRGERSHASSDIDAKVWQDLLRDSIDVRRLERFAGRLAEYLKALDLHRRVHRKKQKLLVKVQQLSRTRRQLHENPNIYLKDVEDYNEIEEDLSEEGLALEVGSQVEDEIEDWLDSGLYSDNGGSKISEEMKEYLIDDEASLNMDMYSSVRTEEEIVDELDNLSRSQTDRRRQKAQPDELDYDDAIVDKVLEDEVGIGRGLHESERYVADRFAEASTLSDVEDIIDLLPDDVKGSMTPAHAYSSSQLLKETSFVVSLVPSVLDSFSQDADISSMYADSLQWTAPSTEEPSDAERVDVEQQQQQQQQSIEHALLSEEGASERSSLIAFSGKLVTEHFDMLSKVDDRMEGVADTPSLPSPPRVVSQASGSESRSSSRRWETDHKEEEEAEEKETDGLCSAEENALLWGSDDSRSDRGLSRVSFIQRSRCIEDDLVALDTWKKDQKSLIKQLLPKLGYEMESEARNNDVGSDNDNDNFVCHFGIVETLLKTRFGAEGSSDNDPCSLPVSWTDKSDSILTKDMEESFFEDDFFAYPGPL